MTSSDWQAETKDRLEKSKIYLAIRDVHKADPANSRVLSIVDEAVFYAYQRTKMIVLNMKEYTLHDGDHLFRVLHLMEMLLGDEAVAQLTLPESMLLILAAFFHDIGMAPEVKEVAAWRKVWDVEVTFESSDEESQYNEFSRFCQARPGRMERIARNMGSGAHSASDLEKEYLISDFIRSTHADRARTIIGEDWVGKIKYQDMDLTTEFAEVCFSHNEDPLTVLSLDCDLLCAPGERSNLQLVALILRLADLLDFDAKRTPSVLHSHLFVRHPVSIQEWNKHRSVQAWDITAESVQFHAKCEHPAIEAAIHSFCDVIDSELAACSNIAQKINKDSLGSNRQIDLRIPFKVDRSKITTKTDVYGDPKYLYRNTQFTLTKDRVVELLMGTKLYGNPEVALRELLQNSIDACLLRQAQESSWGQPYLPEITVRYEEGASGADSYIEVEDNGTGMDQYILDNFYTKIGTSFYTSSDFYDLRSKSAADFVPTSRFGIGILSCFMVADTIEVETRRVVGPHDSKAPLKLTIEGQDSIFWIRAGELKVPGTRTRLHLRIGSNPWHGLDASSFIESVQQIVPNPAVTISIESGAENAVSDKSSFQKLSPDSLSNYSWADHTNIRKIELRFDDEELGIVGSAVVAILETHNEPVAAYSTDSITKVIDGDDYQLEKGMSVSIGCIDSESTSITIDEDGYVSADSGTNELCTSRSRVSLNGIEIPFDLFPDRWGASKSKAKIKWPLPTLLLVDVFGNSDLDLNSSRTEILDGEKWRLFEENLASLICRSLRDSLEMPYWKSLKNVLVERSRAGVFREVILAMDS